MRELIRGFSVQDPRGLPVLCVAQIVLEEPRQTVRAPCQATGEPEQNCFGSWPDHPKIN